MNKRQKKKSIKIKNKKLIKEHPYLLPRNVWTGKVRKDYDYSYTEYDHIPKGWKIGFGKFLLEDLKVACLKTNFLDKLRFSQIKEKYGTLRMYNFGAPQEVHNVLEKYEFISEHVCIQCGSPYACIVNDYGWCLPLCECCWNKNNKKRAIKEYKTYSWDEVSNKSEIGIPNEYKIKIYSNGHESTEIYDISTTVNKIVKAYEKRQKKNKR